MTGARDSPRRRRAWRYGRLAEAVGVWFLRIKGYRILVRGFRSPVGQIDIVARRGRTLAVVEVKARTDPGRAAEAIGPRQRRRIVRATEAFLMVRPAAAELNIRFDVILVSPWRLPVHLVDAWRV